MYDCNQLVYLDVQKTGSTYVRDFLNETCTLPLKKYKQHGRIGRNYNKENFYFNTIRHPESYYRSLFRYGLDGRGAIYGRLVRKGYGDLYQGDSESFNHWLRFILKNEHAHLLGEDFKTTAQKLDIGFLTHRFLMLSLVKPRKTIKWIHNRKELLQNYPHLNIADYTIRQEYLNKGLEHLATVLLPQHFDQQNCRYFLQKNPSINQSYSLKTRTLHLEKDTKALLKHKDQLIFNLYEE